MSELKYPNLRAEMARKSVSIQQIAEVLNKRRAAVSGKIAGRYPFNLDEAFILAREFFPEHDVNYLFATGDTKDHAS